MFSTYSVSNYAPPPLSPSSCSRLGVSDILPHDEVARNAPSPPRKGRLNEFSSSSYHRSLERRPPLASNRATTPGFKTSPFSFYRCKRSSRLRRCTRGFKARTPTCWFLNSCSVTNPTSRATFLAHNPSPTPYFDSAAESDYLRPLAAKPKASRKGKEKVDDPPLPQEPSYYERPPSDVGGMEPLLAERLFNAPPLLQVASEAPRTQPRLVLRDPVQNPVGSYQNPMYSDPARSSTLLTMEPAGASPSSARDDPEDLDTAMARPSSPLTLSQIAREDAIAVGQGSVPFKPLFDLSNILSMQNRATGDRRRNDPFLGTSSR
ncbi:hypothetical protein C8R47DRAFT_1084748 [Mycena vitilis]|nr:hypothetical protein C8R47DRAFT_1084748 [Mycena vitilis]